jgi:hypothetical protein
VPLVRVSRRALAGLVGAALAVAACGPPPDAGVAASPWPGEEQPGEFVPLRAYPVGSDWFVGENNFGVALLGEDGLPIRGAAVTLAFYDLRDRERPLRVGEAAATESVPASDPRVGAYYARVEFPRPGLWGAEIRAALQDGRTGVARVAFAVTAKPSVAAPGQPAPRSDNLTAAEVADLRVIDSGNPPNRMHTWKIRDAIAQGWPLVVVFATPAYCTSMACGPVVEEVQALADEYDGQVAFVHIEVWADPAAGQVHRAVREWLVRSDGGFSEPWVFIVDRRGIIFDRWAGPVSRELLEPSVAAVARGEVWERSR